MSVWSPLTGSLLITHSSVNLTIILFSPGFSTLLICFSCSSLLTSFSCLKYFPWDFEKTVMLDFKHIIGREPLPIHHLSTQSYFIYISSQSSSTNASHFGTNFKHHIISLINISACISDSKDYKKITIVLLLSHFKKLPVIIFTWLTCDLFMVCLI